MIGFYYFLALFSGFAVALQLGINNQLRSRLGNPILSSLVSFAVGLITLLIILAGQLLKNSESLSKISNIKNVSIWMYTGGALGACYVLTTIIVSPKIGFANMFSIIVGSQLIFSIIFDHFGFLGTPTNPINFVKIIGVFLLIAGIFIIQKS